MEQRGSKPSRAAIMVARVLIKGGYQLGRGLGRRLEGIAQPEAIQENLGRARLGYDRTNTKGRPNRRTQKAKKRGQIKPHLYQHFISGGIILLKQNKGESTEAKALAEIERMIKQESPKFQSLTEDLEVINLGGEEEKKEVGKHMPPNLRRSLIELLKDYADGTFYYKVMPFGLKNVGATYQRVMLALFHDMIHKEIEVYVDDMIAKSKTPEQHVEDLWKLFVRLRKYKLRLNPTKRTFGVKSGKLLGFVVNERGIEVDLDKLLHKNQKMEWNPDCQEAFEKIKKYLEDPLVLVPTRYPTLERTCCTLVWATKRLRQYMLANTTWLISKIDPIKYIFEKLALIGRIARWQMTLSEYNIMYMSQKAIKGSTLAEHLSYHPISDYQLILHEFPDEHIMTIVEIELESNEWKMWFDGASNLLGNGIGAVLASPKDQCFPFSARLGFYCINNMVEYEACAMGIMMALEHQVKKLKIFGDSALVIYQLRGEWETRDTKLIPYHNHVKEMIDLFHKITFHHILQEEN
ncbi:Retrovirus-related Pol polyprotein from transposon 17.6, partial [Mucuna pruriens]